MLHATHETSALLERIERISGRCISASEGALIGNRAGVTEWANPRWLAITGFASEETLGKPVSQVLAESDVDPDVPSFIEDHFAAGLRCVVSLPFQRRDGAKLWLQLEVLPELDERREPVGFVALLQDVSEARGEASSHPPPAESPPRRRETAPHSADLRACVKTAMGGLAESLPTTVAIDASCDEDVPAIAMHGEALAELIRSLAASAVGAMDDTWGTLSMSTGIALPGVPLRSETYRSSFFGTCHERETLAFVEIHDTAPSLRPDECRALCGGDSVAGVREPIGRVAVMLRARRELEEAGARLHVASAPGAGTRLLLLLPLA